MWRRSLQVLWLVLLVASWAEAAPQNLDGLDLTQFVALSRSRQQQQQRQQQQAPEKDGESGDEDAKKEPVAILKQINEQNEDGSYTYGYEAADGSFKLETRYPNGLVQGKYGYIDIDTGEVKVIEYGADMMGFQPAGDLPEGIIIPPPVFNNFSDPEESDYDYDYYTEEVERPTFKDESRVVVENRARGSLPGRAQTPLPVSQQRQQVVQQQLEQSHQQEIQRQQVELLKNQNRGQELDRPITPRPLSRASRPRVVPEVRATPERPRVVPEVRTPERSRVVVPEVRLPERPRTVPEVRTPEIPSRFHADPFQTSFRPIANSFQPRPRLPRPTAAPVIVTTAAPEPPRLFSPAPVPAVQQLEEQPARRIPPRILRPRIRQPVRPTPVPAAPVTAAPVATPVADTDPVAALRAIASGRNPTQTLSRTRNPVRPLRTSSTATSVPATPREQPRRSFVTTSVSSSSSSSSANRFSSFPARGASPVRAQRVEESAAAPAAETPKRPIRIRPRPTAARVQPTEAPQRPQQPQILPPNPRQRLAVAASGRPLQTPVRPTPQVDFDALIEEFTGGRTSAVPVPTPQPFQHFQPVAAVPGSSNGPSFSLVAKI